MLAIIGGSGLSSLSNLQVTRRAVVCTPYGETSDALTLGKVGGRDVVFLARHGGSHAIPPHEINYRANIWALNEQGVKTVIAIAAVGGIRGDLIPGALLVPDQIIDYTHGRAATFHTQADWGLRHVDFTFPYCQRARAACISAAAQAGIAIADGGVYAATQGPRLETVAEINRLERDGADVVGMTGMPEAILAREIGLSYATIAVVANHAAGRGSDRQVIDIEQINSVLARSMGAVRLIIDNLVDSSAY
jgi:5'-deoxy-5'-methylthioadenosine phosphorylase